MRCHDVEIGPTDTRTSEVSHQLPWCDYSVFLHGMIQCGMKEFISSAFVFLVFSVRQSEGGVRTCFTQTLLDCILDDSLMSSLAQPCNWCRELWRSSKSALRLLGIPALVVCSSCSCNSNVMEPVPTHLWHLYSRIGRSLIRIMIWKSFTMPELVISTC